MICPKCGSEIKDGAKFCKYCGAAIAATSSADQKPAETSETKIKNTIQKTEVPETVVAGQPAPVQEKVTEKEASAEKAVSEESTPKAVPKTENQQNKSSSGRNGKVILIACIAIALIAAGVGLGLKLVNSRAGSVSSDESSETVSAKKSWYSNLISKGDKELAGVYSCHHNYESLGFSEDEIWLFGKDGTVKYIYDSEIGTSNNVKLGQYELGFIHYKDGKEYREIDDENARTTNITTSFGNTACNYKYTKTDIFKIGLNSTSDYTVSNRGIETVVDTTIIPSIEGFYYIDSITLISGVYGDTESLEFTSDGKYEAAKWSWDFYTQQYTVTAKAEGTYSYENNVISVAFAPDQYGYQTETKLYVEQYGDRFIIYKQNGDFSFIGSIYTKLNPGESFLKDTNAVLPQDVPEQNVEDNEPVVTDNTPSPVGSLYLLEDLNIRTGPGTNYENVGMLKKGASADYYDYISNGDLTWFNIGQDQWIATDGTWIDILSGPGESAEYDPGDEDEWWNQPAEPYTQFQYSGDLKDVLDAVKAHCTWYDSWLKSNFPDGMTTYRGADWDVWQESDGSYSGGLYQFGDTSAAYVYQFTVDMINGQYVVTGEESYL